MKPRILWVNAAVLGSLLGLVMTGCAGSSEAENLPKPDSLHATSVSAAADKTASPSRPTVRPEPVEGTEVELSASQEDAEAVQPPARPEPAPTHQARRLPEDLKLSPATQDLVKLTQSAVPESVMLAFVTNSTRTFNLGADQIVYLHDLGVPSEVIRAMIEQDRRLRESGGQLAPLETPLQPQVESVPLTASTAADAKLAAAAAPQALPQTNSAASGTPADAVAVSQAPTTNVTYQVFYQALAPYGAWIHVDGYGYCWQPSIVVLQPGWRPYCHGGRWIYTDFGWYWHSDYSWGWATFHYGRWFLHPRWGWCWWPDTVWAPAWVIWRYHPAYCGWAPLPPPAPRSGFGISYVSYGFGWSWFTFVSWTHFQDRHPHRHRVRDEDCKRLARESAPVRDGLVREGDRIVNRGIDPDRVRAHTGREVRPIAVRPQEIHPTENRPWTALRERWEPGRNEVRVPRLRAPESALARAPEGPRPTPPPLPPASADSTSSTPAWPATHAAELSHEFAATVPLAAGSVAPRAAIRPERVAGNPVWSPSPGALTAPSPTPPPEPANTPAPADAAVPSRPAANPGGSPRAVTVIGRPRSQVPGRPESGAALTGQDRTRSRPAAPTTQTWSRSVPAKEPSVESPMPQLGPVIQREAAPQPAPPPSTFSPAVRPQASQNVIVVRPSTPPGFRPTAPHPSARSIQTTPSQARGFQPPERTEAVPRVTIPPSRPTPTPPLTPPNPGLTPPAAPAPVTVSPAPSPPAPTVRPAPSPANPGPPLPSSPRSWPAPNRGRAER
ncbi:MAG: hypothetical protein RMN51_05025 [Verrucomicrobiota bacterium]|nr:hypothetical protein [Limisphaera sp.]MDW8381453.1 hypothetical protein [Verrucomicrobiota bacterium]